MIQDLKRTSKEEILKKIDILSDEEVAEVVDFIEFLHQRRKKDEKNILQLLRQAPGPRIGLEALRSRLAKIQGKMSDTIQELRDERG
jgi:hypothetical protein